MKPTPLVVVALILANGCSPSRIDRHAAEQSLVDSLRADVRVLGDSLRVLDEQLRAARLELQRLKEIDLKPREVPRKPPT